MSYLKNKSGQKLAIFAIDLSATPAAPKTGEAANITAQISLDGGPAAALIDTNPTELDAVNMPGIYIFDLAQAETNADLISIYPTCSTADVSIDPVNIRTGVEAADSVWNALYDEYTDAGTFGKLMDNLRKANRLVDGQAAGTPTTTVIETNLSGYVDGAFDHELMLFVSGVIEGEARPILRHEASNGTFIFEESWTQAPAAADEFVIVPNHIHALSEIAEAVAAKSDNSENLDRVQRVAVFGDSFVTDPLEYQNLIRGKKTYVDGVGGALLTNRVNALDAWLDTEHSSEYDVVLLHVGVNDVTSGTATDVPYFTAQWDRAIDMVVGRGKKLVLTTIAPFAVDTTYGSHAAKEQLIVDANAELLANYTAGENYDVLDVNAILDRDADGYLDPEYRLNTTDLHPTVEGHAALARGFLQTIKRWEKPNKGLMKDVIEFFEFREDGKWNSGVGSDSIYRRKARSVHGTILTSSDSSGLGPRTAEYWGKTVTWIINNGRCRWHKVSVPMWDYHSTWSFHGKFYFRGSVATKAVLAGHFENITVNDNNMFAFYVGTDGLRIEINNKDYSAARVVTGPALSAPDEHTLAVVNSADGLYVYVDNVLVGSDETPLVPGEAPRENVGYFGFGSAGAPWQFGDTNTALNAYITDFGFYSKALSESEINQLSKIDGYEGLASIGTESNVDAESVYNYFTQGANEETFQADVSGIQSQTDQMVFENNRINANGTGGGSTGPNDNKLPHVYPAT
jgi:lysophospholipase L1-like esterase